jgi:hypothetical protein
MVNVFHINPDEYEKIGNTHSNFFRKNLSSIGSLGSLLINSCILHDIDTNKQLRYTMTNSRTAHRDSMSLHTILQESRITHDPANQELIALQERCQFIVRDRWPSCHIN